MNRVVLFEHDQFNSQLYSLRDIQRVEHLINHVRVSKGDELKVTIINKGLTKAKVQKVSGDEIILEVDNQLDTPHFPEVALIVATSRPPTLKKVIEHATTLGVSHFHFFTAKLSEKSYLKSKVLERSKLEELATLGIAQSGQVWKFPTFTFSNNLEEVIETVEGQNYILSLRQGKTLVQYNMDTTNRSNFFIGPERGWTQQEEELLLQHQVQPVILSRHILRVETACFALLSQLEMLQLNC